MGVAITHRGTTSTKSLDDVIVAGFPARFKRQARKNLKRLTAKRENMCLGVAARQRRTHRETLQDMPGTLQTQASWWCVDLLVMTCRRDKQRPRLLRGVGSGNNGSGGVT